MIILVNGSFGVGKTSVAEILVNHIPNSLLYDPEIVGSCVRSIVRPIEQFEDFQDLPMWRTLTITTAQLLKQTYRRTLVVPMTIWFEPYFQEIISGLQQFEPDLFHFCLTANAKTIFERLERRRSEHSSEDYAWICQRVEGCVDAFQSPIFAVQIGTDNRIPDEIAFEILNILHKELINAYR
jgi:deoxyadenosine/deoxycytidine kinase